MIHDVEHLFLCLLATCGPSLEEFVFKSLAHFSMGLCVGFVVVEL